MAFRNTQYEDKKIAELQESLRKLTLALSKPDKYVLTGSANGAVVITVSAWGLAEVMRMYRTSYARLDKAEFLEKAARA